MPWLRIDDGFAEHEKVLDLSDRAFRLHMTGLCQCAKNLTDGFIDAKRLKIIAAIIGRPVTGSVKELIAAGLWAVDGDGHRINDYLEYNPSAEKVKKERAKSSERQARFRAKTRGNDTDELDYQAIAERDEWTCYLCEGKVTEANWSFDHVVPIGYGGSHSYDNVRLCHVRCNKRKGTRPAPGPSNGVTNGVGHTDVSHVGGDGAPSRPVPNPKLDQGPDLTSDSGRHFESNALEPELSVAIERARAASEHHTEGLPINIEFQVGRLMRLIGDHADQGERGHPPTVQVVRSLARRLPESSLGKVIESLELNHPTDRAAYAVGALRGEVDERNAA